MRLKILFVIDNLEFGGGERVFAQIINGLSSERYETFLASNPSEELYQSITNKEVHCIPLDFSKRINLSLFIKLTKIIKDERIDIVHCQGGRSNFYARVATKLSGSAKYISTIATPVEGYNVSFFRKIFYCFLDRFTERFVDQFIVVSDILKKRMIIEHKIPPEKVAKIYNGIEIHHYSPNEEHEHSNKIRNEFNLNTNVIIVGAIGRLVWEKGFEYLIKCLRDVLKEQTEVKAMFVGDGPLRKNLEVLSSQLGIEDKTIFAGFRSDIKEILSAIDILVIPSLLEGFPMVTLEAMAMAKPIIATHIGGITEQISDGVEGVLVPPRDADALAKAIKKVIENKELAHSLGSAARKRVEKEFTVEKMIIETEKVYQSLIT